MINRPLLNGTMYHRRLNGWEIQWEADGDYRHWCTQTEIGAAADVGYIAVLLLNPGSLSGDGENLRRDTTLRILREVFSGSGLGCLVVNLFDRATAKPPELFRVWNERDKAGSRLVHELVPHGAIHAHIVAFGDYENHDDRSMGVEIGERARSIRNVLSATPLVRTPHNRTGTPMHVMRWQIEEKKLEVADALLALGPGKSAKRRGYPL